MHCLCFCPLRLTGDGRGGGGGGVSSGEGLLSPLQLFLCRQSPSCTVNDFSTTSFGVMDLQRGVGEGQEEREEEEMREW